MYKQSWQYNNKAYLLVRLSPDTQIGTKHTIHLMNTTSFTPTVQLFLYTYALNNKKTYAYYFFV